MINFLNDYTTKILCLAVFVGLIQLILPKGKLKQNVLFSSMIFVSLVIIEPIVDFMNDDFDITKVYEENKNELYLASNQIDYESYYNQKVKNTYEENLRNDMVKRLEEAGYKINSIKCECDEDTLEPKSLRVEIETRDGTVQPVRIEISNNNTKNEAPLMDKLKIQKIAYENYGINGENVIVESFR